MPDSRDELLNVILTRLDTIDTFVQVQIEAGRQQMATGTLFAETIDALIAADKLRAAEIAQIKQDVAALLEMAKAGVRH